jgi:hypothetical protein
MSLGGSTLVATPPLARQSVSTTSSHTSAAWTPEALLEAPKVDIIENIIAALANLIPIIKVIEPHPLNPWTEEELLAATGLNPGAPTNPL